ncbi:MAG: M12 family metallo-peptidase [Planctomycetota bacterium]|nr:M12 family metallo-peptidase [Planctomycetota bacterium]
MLYVVYEWIRLGELDVRESGEICHRRLSPVANGDIIQSPPREYQEAIVAMNIRFMPHRRARCLFASMALATASTSLLAFDASISGTGITSADANQAMNLLDSSVQELVLVELPAGKLDLSVTLGDRETRMRFNLHSVRGDAYQLLEQQPDGSLMEIPAGPVNTYRGTDVTWPGMQAALSIEDDGFRVMILLDGGENWWIEPLEGRVRNATDLDYVVYRGEDIISPEGFCGVEEKHKLPGMDVENTMPLDMDRQVLYAEFVADTDFEYYQDYGSSSAVENRINSLVNTINLQYETQVEIINQLQGIVVRPDSNDPYSSNSIDTRLTQVGNVWNSTNNPPHDVVQLFSGADFSGSTIGLAWLSAVCSNVEYSVVESDCCGSFGCATDLSVHELGHNWGADHCSCPSNTMNPSLTCANNFSSNSIGDITAFRNSIASCLDVASGACCTTDGFCAEVSEDTCDNVGGDFQGVWVDCDDVDCAVPGACCLASGSCVALTSSGCASAGGNYEGDGTDCATVNCPQPDPTGACCLGDGSCLDDETEADCQSSGGNWQGDSTDCGFLTCDEENEIVEAHHAVVGANLLSLSEDTWTVDVYAAVGQGNRVDAVAGNSLQQKLISSSSGFYQDAAGGPTSADINPAFYSFVPDLEWDSRVTIGALDQTGDPFGENALGDVGIDWTNFENGGTLSVDNGTWYVLPTDAQGESQPFISQDCSQQYGVLLARLTAFDLNSTISLEALVQGRDSADNTWQDSVSYTFTYEATEDCNSNGVADNCDIANGTSEDTDGNGVPDECDSTCPGDADGDGDSDVDDILLALSNFGGSGDGDMDNDGDVDVDDLLQILSYFGNC